MGEFFHNLQLTVRPQLDEEATTDAGLSDSDREYKLDDDTDVDILPLPNDGISLDAPYKLVVDRDDDLAPVLLYDIRAGIPNTVVSLPPCLSSKTR